MMRLLPVLLLSLTACDALPSLLGTAVSAAQSATAEQVNSATGTTTVTPATPVPAATTTSTGPTAAATTPSSATKTVSFDTAKKLEYVDVWVNMGDPQGQRALVPYLMKPKDWMLVGCEMTSATSKHYRFMKVSTADGKESPEVDIFSPRR